MKSRVLLTALLSLTVSRAFASDVSPFYKSIFAVSEREACAKPTATTGDVSPFYKSIFVASKAERCATATAKDAATDSSDRVTEAPAPAQPKS